MSCIDKYIYKYIYIYIYNYIYINIFIHIYTYVYIEEQHTAAELCRLAGQVNMCLGRRVYQLACGKEIESSDRWPLSDLHTCALQHALSHTDDIVLIV